jgi:hypothetical protein
LGKHYIEDNNGGARRAVATSLGDESSQSCNSNVKEVG